MPHHFEFDLDSAIREQVIAKLEASPYIPLGKNLAPKESGIYALYYLGNLVYVGKASSGLTSSGRTLRSRLNEHVGKINKRQNIQLSDLQCRYLTFESEWWVFAAELSLMQHYSPQWNNSGFGSKVPGKGRPGTSRVSAWDSQFPPKP